MTGNTMPACLIVTVFGQSPGVDASAARSTASEAGEGAVSGTPPIGTGAIMGTGVIFGTLESAGDGVGVDVRGLGVGCVIGIIYADFNVPLSAASDGIAPQGSAILAPSTMY